MDININDIFKHFKINHFTLPQILEVIQKNETYLNVYIFNYPFKIIGKVS